MLLLYNLILFLYTLARRRRPRERTPSVQRLSPLWVGPMSPYPRRRRPLRGHLLLSVKTACPTMGHRPLSLSCSGIFLSDEGWTTYRDESRPYPLAAPRGLLWLTWSIRCGSCITVYLIGLMVPVLKGCEFSLGTFSGLSLLLSLTLNNPSISYNEHFNSQTRYI